MGRSVGQKIAKAMNATIRCGCGAPAAFSEIINFEYKGARIATFKEGGICHPCFRRKYLKEVKMLEGQNYISFSKGRIAVNWKKCLMLRYDKSEHSPWDKLLGVLVDFNVLSFKPDGNYLIMRGQEPHILSLICQKIYFTSVKSATDYIVGNKNELEGVDCKLFRLREIKS